MSNLEATAKRLLELAGKATPGPWKWDCTYLESEDTTVLVDNTYEEFSENVRDEDQAYIAACDPTTIRQLAECVLEIKEALVEILQLDRAAGDCGASVAYDCLAKLFPEAK